MFTGPNIVRDGLVLSLDAANIKSFRGEPTTNMCGNPTSFYNSWNNSGSQILNTDDTTIPRLFEDVPVMSTYKDVAGQSHISPGGATGIVSGNIYTLSVYVYIPGYVTLSGGTSPYIRPQPDNISVGQLLYNGSGNWVNWDRDRWIRCEGTFTASVTATSVYISSYYINLGEKIYFTAPQIELKDHVTHYTTGTRGTTVATGGGWKDLSGLGNHGELINNPTWDSENGGSLVFNGSNNTTYDTGGYIDITNSSSLNNLTEFTLSFCIYSYGAQSSNGASVFHKGNETNTGFICEPYGGDIRVNYGDGSAWYWTRFLTPLTHNTYSIFDYVYDGISLKIYKNGVLQSSNNITISWDNTNLIRIGRRRGHLNHYLYGKLPYERFYNKALSQSEIQQNFNALRTRFGI